MSFVYRCGPRAPPVCHSQCYSRGLPAVPNRAASHFGGASITSKHSRVCVMFFQLAAIRQHSVNTMLELMVLRCSVLAAAWGTAFADTRPVRRGPHVQPVKHSWSRAGGPQA